MAATRRLIRVTGTVQGVGFRPFVYRHATALELAGSVRNDSAGVLIDVEGDSARISELARLLVDDPPPLAAVGSVTFEDAEPVGRPGPFRIVASDEAASARTVPVSVDTATCVECLAEVDDPADRRYRYPFTNCTNCGPRYTIVLRVPYDRPSTTMAGFVMCDACRREYDDPMNRRFHAQPNACPVCGPQLTWRAPDGTACADGDEALGAAVARLRSGGIVAVKGVGGYHLAVDATDDDAVRELRRRKARDDKPFAVMVRDVRAARALCDLDTRAVAALVDARRPIVLVPRRAGAGVAEGVAPGLPDLGVFLPYTPLHHLVLSGVDRPLVMTSANSSDEPIAHDDDDAVARLGPMVDGLLTHDRRIHIRCDDSVARAAGDRLQLLRRSRGYAPEPLPLPFPTAARVLAVGGELKSTVSVSRGDEVVASHHIGDLEHLATWQSFRQAVEHLPALYGVVPEIVAHDLHPEYLSTKFALDLDLPNVAVQHHHAHVASCMVEHGRRDPVVALAFDGLGYGPDGTLWGGEVLVADFSGYERVAHLRPLPMPGGSAAIREPWRMALVWARAAGRSDPGPLGLAAAGLDPATVDAVADLVGRGEGRATTSIGRLFDAVAVLLGCRARVTYEAQAAIELEALARAVDRDDAPSFADDVLFADGVLDPAPLVDRIVRERARGIPNAVLAAAFHESIGLAAARVARDVAGTRGIDAVVLTGGVFQNVRLGEIVTQDLGRSGVTVLVHERVPPNDGGLSIGQAAIAAFDASS
jgi:hydrogenase maturation protein HypF